MGPHAEHALLLNLLIEVFFEVLKTCNLDNSLKIFIIAGINLFMNFYKFR